MIYLDHNATTPVRPEVVEAMLPFLRQEYGNPSSVYFLGQKARRAVESSREAVADLIGAKDSQEIVFASCGSEANAMAVFGAAYGRNHGRPHFVTSAVEHPSVLKAFEILQRRGMEVGFAGADPFGKVSPREVESLTQERTVLVSVMHANNEVGTIEPVEEIAEICRARGVLFHTDAVQSAGKIPIQAEDWGLDLLSLSGHKLNAPKGIGALYVRRGVSLEPLIPGKQEKNRRGGTQNVAAIVGLGEACRLAKKELAGHHQKLLKLRRALERGILKKVKGARLNGDPEGRLPNTAHFSFESLEGHNLVVALDLQGLCVSGGPACSSGAPEPSHVLKAMGVPDSFIRGSVRFSLGWGSTEEEIERALEVVPQAVEQLRQAGVA